MIIKIFLSQYFKIFIYKLKNLHALLIFFLAKSKFLAVTFIKKTGLVNIINFFVAHDKNIEN